MIPCDLEGPITRQLWTTERYLVVPRAHYDLEGTMSMLWTTECHLLVLPCTSATMDDAAVNIVYEVSIKALLQTNFTSVTLSPPSWNLSPNFLLHSLIFQLS
jgi:hypothetical protein